MPKIEANGVTLYYEHQGTGERLLVISGTGGDLRQQPPGARRDMIGAELVG